MGHFKKEKKITKIEIRISRSLKVANGAHKRFCDDLRVLIIKPFIGMSVEDCWPFFKKIGGFVLIIIFFFHERDI